jgi:flavin reductase (DIM6/NTAB) family NADH-FMN oxidoreductase RutF
MVMRASIVIDEARLASDGWPSAASGKFMDPADFHYYEPSKGHGLRHNPFNAIVAPRPIGWISSRNAAGQPNLAPYSFFNAFLYDPPIIGFSSISWKDTVKNVSETREFVWNLPATCVSQPNPPS